MIKLKEILNEIENEQISIDEIKQVISSVLPSHFKFWVEEADPRSFGFDKNPWIRIVMAVSDYKINGVRGQYPGVVSLIFYPKQMELKPQIFGGNGGRDIYRNTDPTIEREKYLALGRERIPFRQPAPNKKAVLTALKKFVQNYLIALKNIKDRGLWPGDGGELEL